MSSKAKSGDSDDHGIRADEVIFEDVYTESRNGTSADLKYCKEAAQKGSKKQLGGQVTLGTISSDRIDVASAFQLFSGLSIEADDGSGNGETRWSSTTGRGGQRQGLQGQSLQDRLLRIKGELQEVVADAAALSAADSSPEGGIGSAWSVLEEEARRLAAIANRVQLGGGDKSEITPEPIISTAGDSSGDVSGAEWGRGEGGGGGAESMVRLEQRLAVLESCVGCTSSAGKIKGPDASLLASLEQLEQRVAVMDASVLDAVKMKVEAVKKELDLFQQPPTAGGIAAKGAGPGAGAVASPLKVVEAACIIDELYNRSLRVDEVVDALPSIVLRLRSLQTLHAQAAQYSSRMQALEVLVASLASDAAANRELINVLQSGVKANTDVFGENVRQVQARIDQLG